MILILFRRLHRYFSSLSTLMKSLKKKLFLGSAQAEYSQQEDFVLSEARGHGCQCLRFFAFGSLFQFDFLFWGLV